MSARPASEAPAIFRLVLANCAKPPTGERGVSDPELRLLEWWLFQGWRDCQELDRRGGTPGRFEARYFAALAQPFAWLGIRWMLEIPADKRTWRPIWSAFEESEQRGNGALALHWIREMVRDGIRPATAVANAADAIASQAKDGDLAFFSKHLPEALKELSNKPEKFSRPLPAWFRRAWMPLALWEIWDDADAVHGRMLEASNLMGNIALPDLTTAPGLDHFRKAWREFRPRR